MSTLTIMMGLPGLGKSTKANKLIKENKNMVVVSSDDLRAILLKDVYRQDENRFIFDLMLQITETALRNNKDVVYDATNIQEDKRRALVTSLRGQFPNLKVVGVCCIGDYRSAIIYNNNRQRRVPEDVILKMTKQFDVPTKRDSDYFDSVEFSSFSTHMYTFDKFQNFLTINAYANFNSIMRESVTVYKEIEDLPQDCPYHTLSASRHTYAAFDYARKNMPEELEEFSKEILYALAFHDIGKGICKEFRKGSKYAHFTNHEKVSAQIFMAEAARHATLNNLDKEFVAALIKEHSFPYADKDMAKHLEALDNLERIYGADFRKCIEFFREADQSAH